MFVNSDFRELLSIFNDRKVKYLVVGGYAFIKYAEPRYTKALIKKLNHQSFQEFLRKA